METSCVARTNRTRGKKRNWHKSLSLTSPELELLSEMIEDAVASITHGAVQDADSEMLHWTVILTKQF